MQNFARFAKAAGQKAVPVVAGVAASSSVALADAPSRDEVVSPIRRCIQVRLQEHTLSRKYGLYKLSMRPCVRQSLRFLLQGTHRSLQGTASKLNVRHHINCIVWVSTMCLTKPHCAMLSLQDSWEFAELDKETVLFKPAEIDEAISELCRCVIA